MREIASFLIPLLLEVVISSGKVVEEEKGSVGCVVSLWTPPSTDVNDDNVDENELDDFDEEKDIVVDSSLVLSFGDKESFCSILVTLLVEPLVLPVVVVSVMILFATPCTVLTEVEETDA